ncbi:uncharacterized protein [Haliotis asinina]|uniref:uncharacterized protein n=1 Tax=Haliotis asinina TaxID=109174 RepID=UPI0035327308
MNTDLRKLATSDLNKILHKLMNNLVFGKTMGNLRKRVNVKPVRSTGEEKLKKLIASLAFNQSKIFDDDLVAVLMDKIHIEVSRPVYMRMSLLDLQLSKHLMYEFYYNELKKQYVDGCEVLYTDFLLMEICTEDVYEFMKKRIHLYDTSDIPKEHPLHNTANKTVLGKIKGECVGMPVAECVGLRTEMYSIKKVDDNEIRKVKGVKKSGEKHTKHAKFKQVSHLEIVVLCLSSGCPVHEQHKSVSGTQLFIQSYTHRRRLERLYSFSRLFFGPP